MTRYDLLASRQGRDGKKYWIKVGVLFPLRDGSGFSWSLDAVPVPDIHDGRAEIGGVAKPPREASERPAPRQQAGKLDDDIPF